MLVEKYGSRVGRLLDDSEVMCPWFISRLLMDLVFLEENGSGTCFNSEVVRQVRNGRITRS